MLQEAKEVCPTITRRMAADGALLVYVRESGGVRALAFDVPVIVTSKSCTTITGKFNITTA